MTKIQQITSYTHMRKSKSSLAITCLPTRTVVHFLTSIYYSCLQHLFRYLVAHTNLLAENTILCDVATNVFRLSQPHLSGHSRLHHRVFPALVYQRSHKLFPALAPFHVEPALAIPDAKLFSQE